MIPADTIRWMIRSKKIKKKMSKVRIGLPKEVSFVYNKGVVICRPKERKWLVMPNGAKKSIVHIIADEDRVDVTKYKARRFLKLAIIGELRDDSKNK